MNVTLCRTFQFDAAHRNTSPAATAKTARLHGHTYEAEIRVSGPIDEPMGWLLDFGEIKDAGRVVVGQLDHRCLNEVDGLSDTTVADIGRWSTAQLHVSLGDFASCEIRICGATALNPRTRTGYKGARRKRIEFGFAAAHLLPRLPETHKCRRLHGHSFGVEVATDDAHATIASIRSIYPKLDHTNLNDIAGLENPTSETIAGWLWDRLDGNRIVHEIVVSETCTTRCIFQGP